ncbi:hypothetical protein UB46_37335 [Burkholderiaceae bacterium 16]|nr:hypothetical protein UB46_37335 [Burkholderiaceae bacterium 16]
MPVVSVVWTYNGLSAEDMARRIATGYERSLTNSVEDIEHIESQSLSGVAVIKIFFHPGADINRAIAETLSGAQSMLRNMPPGTTPPLILSYSASTVPILRLAVRRRQLIASVMLVKALGGGWQSAPMTKL